MRRGAAATALTALLAVSACSGGSDDGPRYPRVAAPAVKIAAPGAPTGLTFGVIVSAASPLGQGADLAPAAAGVAVAAYRLKQGGVTVTLQVVDDRGTSKGAEAAVRQLSAAGVSGIVAATQGDHLDAALALATKEGLAVVLPYEHRDLPATGSAWSLAPDEASLRQGLTSLLAAQGRRQPFVLHGEGYDDQVLGLASPAYTRALVPADSPATSVAPVLAARRLARGAIDCVVIAASPDTQAALVTQLQGSAPDLPIVLSTAATGPRFGQLLATQLLADGTATTAGSFQSVGLDTVDATAQGSGPDSSALTAFLSGARLAAQDTTVRSLLHPQSTAFGAEGAATADAASHDALLALVRAAQKAASTEPAKVLAALSGLTLRGDGLAGPRLSFATRHANDAEVVGLQSTTEGTGQRPGIAQPLPPLSWFVLPTSGA